MILLWGLSGDGPFDRVRAALEGCGARFRLLDQRAVLRTGLEVTCDPDLHATAFVSGKRLPLDDVSAVYWRAYDVRRLPGMAAEDGEDGRDGRDGRDDGPPQAMAHALEQGLVAWLEVADARVVNRPSSMASNNSKPYQATVLREHGFEVPETLITTDPQAVLRFWTDHGAVIYKSISGARSVVSRVTAAHVPRLEHVVWCPTQFQQYVPGLDVRVHVVGDDVFACEVLSDADDYRYPGGTGGSVEIRASRLPGDIAARCIAVTRALGMHLSGIDLRLAPDGRWFAFEVNPSPGFTYYEDHTGQPITSALAGLLTSGRSP
jgi:hypothetical protein